GRGNNLARASVNPCAAQARIQSGRPLMKILMLTAGAAALALSAGGAGAAAKMTGPPQPIPYSKLDAYLKATPKQRAKMDLSADASASAPATSATTGANTDTATTVGADTSVNPTGATEAAPGMTTDAT